jgi:hypothetical protein
LHETPEWSAKPFSIGALPELDSDAIVYRRTDALLTTEVSLGCLYGNMTQEELNLLQFAAGSVTESSAGATRVVGSKRVIRKQAAACSCIDGPKRSLQHTKAACHLP